MKCRKLHSPKNKEIIPEIARPKSILNTSTHFLRAQRLNSVSEFTMQFVQQVYLRTGKWSWNVTPNDVHLTFSLMVPFSAPPVLCPTTVLCHARAGKCHKLPWKTSAALDARKTHLDKLTSPDMGFQYLPSLRAITTSKWHMSLKDPPVFLTQATPTRWTDLHIISLRTQAANTKDDEHIKYPADSVQSRTQIISQKQRFKIRVLEVSCTCSSKVFARTGLDTWHVSILTLENLWFFPGVFRGLIPDVLMIKFDRLRPPIRCRHLEPATLRRNKNLSDTACEVEPLKTGLKNQKVLIDSWQF